MLVFEPSALIETNIHFWREVSRLGQCILPKIAYKEIKHTIKSSPLGRSPNSTRDNAIQFLKFFPSSGWQETDLSRTHQEFELQSGHLVSRKLRVNLEIAKSAFGTAYLNPHALVVLVTNDQTLLKRVNDLRQINLCAATTTGTRQWVRTAQAPAAISKAIVGMQARHQQIEQTASNIPTTATKSLADHSLGKAQVVRPISRSPRSTGNTAKLTVVNPPKSNKTIISWGLGWLVMMAAIIFAWSVLKPAQFNQFWQKRVIPVLPNSSPQE